MRKLAHNSKDYTGLKIKSWSILEYSHTDTGRKQHYLCRCDCGREVIKNVCRILYGYSNSCGCKNIENHIKHNKSNSMVYNVWQNMKNRCTNKNSTQWKWYGGRGIKVCDQWLNSFESFYQDMGDPPTKNHSIDRINNHGNYERDNCKWSTKSEQAKNRRLPEPPKQ